jgi:hypothetical protein
MSDRFVKTRGGVAATHPRRRLQPVLVAPDTTGEINTIQEEILPVACVRLEDILFEFDSSIVGPAVSDEIQELAKLRRDVPGMPLSLFGHADPVGNDAYNKLLSGRRAQAVYALLTRKVDLWEDLYKNPHGGDNWRFKATQVMLKKLGHYDGELHGRLNGPTKDAVEAFQRSPAGAGLEPDRDPGPLTREKLFRAYMDAICLDDVGQPFQLDPVADFIAHGADAKGKGDYQGCSEFNPVRVFSQEDDRRFRNPAHHQERNERNLINRRVLIFLFRPGFSISPDSWPCPRAKEGSEGCRRRFFGRGEGDRRRNPQEVEREYKDNHDTFGCRFYDRLAQESPCELGGPPVQSHLMAVHLKLQWRDPLNTVHDFPPGLSVGLQFPSGQSLRSALGPGGVVSFLAVDQRNESFTVSIDSAEGVWIGTAPPNAPGQDPEQLLPEAGVRAKIEQGFRVFELPRSEWTSDKSTWEATGATLVDGAFTQLESLGDTLGTPTSPVTLVLDPHWLFLKFLYFDRHLKRRLPLPAIMMEGFRRAPAAGGSLPDVADTRSNWRVRDEVQCLPWVLQEPPKPDRNIVVQFRSAAFSRGGRTVARTFIDARQNRRLVTAETSPDVSSDDLGINRGASSAINFDEPNAARLGFYDLPPLWRSSRYLARLPGNTNKFFDQLTDGEVRASANRDSTRPLTFDLDDIVLVTDRLQNAGWNPSQDRVAIFSNLLHQGIAAGLHRPDATTPYLSLPPTGITNRNYLIDHPDFTRLIVMGSSLFDVFDHRTPESNDLPVGARAAVRWFDGTSLGGPPTSVGVQSPRPPAPGRSFAVVQGFFDQNHPNRGSIGRFDMALLRCCDVDGENEVAVNLHYYRYGFDFAPAPIPARNTQPNTVAAGAQPAWVNDAVNNLHKRWNGPDGSFHPGGAQLITGPLAAKVRVPIIFFFQAFPQPLSGPFVAREVSYRIDIFKKVRAFMSSGTGRGALEETENKPDPDDDSFTLAHESGHGDSLEDEYIETSNHASYFNLGFEDFIPGSPYFADRGSMMKDNIIVRPRHYWHSAEWARTVSGTEFLVQHDGFVFRLPQHTGAPRQTFVTTPWRDAPNTHPGASGGSPGGFCDVFLFRLGREPFGHTVLTNGPFDGFISVVLKMKCKFLDSSGNEETNHNRLRDRVSKIRNGIQERLNGKFFVTGDVGGETFRRCRLSFSPRFLVVNDSGDADYHRKVGVSATQTYAQVVAGVESSFGKHFDVFVRDGGSTGLQLSSAGAGRLDFNRDALDLEDDFPRFFAGMLGVDTFDVNAVDRPGSYVPVVQTVIPNGRVFRIS